MNDSEMTYMEDMLARAEREAIGCVCEWDDEACPVHPVEQERAS